MSYPAGTVVRISSTPWYHSDILNKPRRAPRKFAGRQATVLDGGPDRCGDLPVKIDGIFYADQLAPECLTVIGGPVS